jgi:hypothetical protein
MGSSIGTIAGTALGGAGGFMLGGPAGALVGAGIGGKLGGSIDAPGGDAAAAQINQVDPRISKVQEYKVKQAKDYDANLKNLQTGLINSATDSNRLKDYQDRLSNTRSMGARGALYGGMAENQASSISAKNMSDLNKQTAGINYQTQQYGQDLNQSALSSGIALQALQQQQTEAAYNAAMAAQQRKARGVDDAASSLAGLGGFGGLL